jgi:hypothetical protein
MEKEGDRSLFFVHGSRFTVLKRTGNREQGTGNGERGAGNGERGAGKLEEALRREIGVLSRDDQWDAYGLKRVW